MFTQFAVIFFCCLVVLLSLVILFNTNKITLILALNLISFTSAIYYLLLSAPDVAITEVAVGSAISTLFFLFPIKYIIDKNKNHNKLRKRKVKFIQIMIVRSSAFIISTLVLLSLSSFAFYMKSFGGETNKIINLNNKPAEYYRVHTTKEIGSKCIVTGILASYRGFDTMIETFVIFVASIGVLFVLSDTTKKQLDE